MTAELRALSVSDRARLEAVLDEHAAHVAAGLGDLQQRVAELEQLVTAEETEKQRSWAWIAYALMAATPQEARARIVVALQVDVFPPGFGPVRRG